MKVNRKDIVKQSKKIKSWFIDQAVPFWIKYGYDSEEGGFFDILLENGTIDKYAGKSVLSQFRMLFVFNYLDSLGWTANSRAVSDKLYNFIQTKCRKVNGGQCFYKLDARNKVLNDKIDLYNCAFQILANSWHYRVTNKHEAKKDSDELVSYLNNNLRGQGGGWLQGDYLSRFRRANPHMHLFESFLAAFEATNEPKWLARAGEIFNLFETRFNDPKEQILLEYFELDWRPLNDYEGKIVEPGHLFEWIWLLRKYENLVGSPVGSYCENYFRKAHSLGLNDETGLFYDEVTASGEKLVSTQCSWSITEYIKASVAQSIAIGEIYEEHIIKGIKLLFEYFISDKFDGFYIEQVDVEGVPVLNFASANSMYHFLVAIAEVEQYCREKNYYG